MTRERARDIAVRRTQAVVVGVVAGAAVLSGVFTAVAARASSGHPAATAQTRVPGPDHIPAIAGDPAPLQPPAQPPSTATPDPTATPPQVSQGS